MIKCFSLSGSDPSCAFHTRGDPIHLKKVERSKKREGDPENVEVSLYVDKEKNGDTQIIIENLSPNKRVLLKIDMDKQYHYKNIDAQVFAVRTPQK